jgi:hypothetical protein
MPLWSCTAALTLAIVSLTGAADRASGQSATTGQVKAAFLYNFARFTEWPVDAFASASGPLIIGVAGDEVLRMTLDNIIRGKVSGLRPLRTRNVPDANAATAVHILYIGGTLASRAQDFLNAVGAAPVLTVGDDDLFCDRGGMINFLVSDNRVRFEIRVDATEASRIKVSSRVLTLAKTIYGKSSQ